MNKQYTMKKCVIKIECICEYCKKKLKSRYPSKIPKNGFTFCDHKHAILFQRFDPEFANKMKELWKSPEFRRKKSENMKEAMSRSEYKEKIKAGLQDPKVRQKLSESMIKQWKDSEFKQKKVDFMRSLWRDPEWREKHKEDVKKSTKKRNQNFDWLREHNKRWKRMRNIRNLKRENEIQNNKRCNNDRM